MRWTHVFAAIMWVGATFYSPGSMGGSLSSNTTRKKSGKDRGKICLDGAQRRVLSGRETKKSAVARADAALVQVAGGHDLGGWTAAKIIRRA